MKITKSHLEQIILEEVRRGFGQGAPAKDELSKKREVYLEEEVPEEGAGEQPESLKTDVEVVTKRLGGYIEKIDDAAELQQILTYVIGKFAENPKIGSRVPVVLKSIISKLSTNK
tara:strand:- start:7 stop:351 length:345 start_codon:yes stop_codon:yes gene_type:complete